ncbi:MAG: FUSC family protein [Desulfobacteraceae bacterium]|nr:FUSC family protein [Desulfobacteraceae bacterium]
MFQRINLQEAFKLALSVVLFYWLAFWMNWDMPKYGGLAIAVISLDTTGASLRKGLMRIIGTMVGLAVGFLVIGWLAQDRWGNMLFLASYYVVISYFMQGSRYGYAWLVAGFLPSLIWAETYGNVDFAFHYATFRYLETTAGVVVYTLVSALIWPRSAGRQLNRQGKDLWAGIRKLFGLYRHQLTDGVLSAEASDLRTGLAGNVAQMLTTLQAAYVDTQRVMEQKRVWEVLCVNVRALGDALELWREGIDDYRHLDLERLLPRFGSGLETIDKRLQRIADLWQARQAPDDDVGTDDDADLLEPLGLDLDGPAGAELPRFDRAALLSSVQQLQILDLTSRELLRTLRVLAGIDTSRGFRVQSEQRDLFLPSPWQPEWLIKALFPAVCFIVCYIFWIYINPPGGPMVPMMAGAMALSVVMSGMNPGQFLIWMLVIMWAIVAPVYFFVMPALNTGFEILSLLFVYTFFFAVLGGRWPLLRLLPLLLLVLMADIRNQQTYSFIGLVDGGIMFTLVFGSIVVVQMLLSSIRPEQILLRTIRRFFHGCAKITEGFSLYRPKNRTKGQKLRKRYYQSMVLPVPRQLQAVEKNLNYKLFPRNSPGKVKRLMDNLQSISFRLQAVEIAFNRVITRFPHLMETLNPLKNEARARLQRVFKSWASFEGTDVLEDQRAALQELSRGLEQRLDAREKTGEPDLTDERAPREFYALLGTVRGLFQAMVETQNVIKEINWGQWAAKRF